MKQPDCHYRISAKAIIFEDESKQKFLICLEDNGHWELPGGGIDHGTTPQQDIPREIEEEMGLITTFVANFPLAFLTFHAQERDRWFANVCYETKVENLDFTPSEECQQIKFVNTDEALKLENTFGNIDKFAKYYQKVISQ